MEFLNRNIELQKLRTVLDRDVAVFAVLYGRRRIGKSRLLQEITGGSDIYFLADENTRSLQLIYFSQVAARKIPGFDEVQYPDWRSMFTALNNSINGSCTIVLDEFPYLVKSAPELPSVIQNFLDLNPERKFNLVICGSSQRMMQGYVLSSSAPLYGRAREILNLHGLPPSWLSKSLDLDAVQTIEAYSVFGGIPRHCELLSDYSDLWSALTDLVFDRYGILRHEPERLFHDETDTPSQLISLCGLIGGGAHRLSEIAGRIQKKATNLSRPLQNLIEMGYVKREIPFGESVKSTRRTFYKLADPFMDFYFTFVAPNQSYIESGESSGIISSIRKRFNHFAGQMAEQLARRSVFGNPVFQGKFNEAGRWWGAGKNGRPMEIDVISESIDGNSLLVGEVKWEEQVDVQREIKKLQEKAESLPFPNTNRQLVLWTKHGIPELPEIYKGVQLVSAKDLVSVED